MTLMVVLGEIYLPWVQPAGGRRGRDQTKSTQNPPPGETLPVLSPAKRGRFGVGLAALHSKKNCCYRSINDKSPRNSPGKGKDFVKERYDAVQSKLKGSCRADPPSGTQENKKNSHMEC